MTEHAEPTTNSIDDASDIPQWFRQAIAHEPQMESITHEGVRVSYRAWGEPSDPVVVLIHGGAAHSGWWDHVGPFLAAGCRVVAPDLAGHGDSDYQDEYSLDSWAAQVMAVAAAQNPEPPSLIGHSMGGFVALTAACDSQYELRGAVAIDSPVRQMSTESRAWVVSQLAKKSTHKVHPSRAEVEQRFRTLPEDDATLEYVRAHIAAGSVKAVDGGWSWKFDPHIFLSSYMQPDWLAAAPGPIALIRGERGMATVDITESVASILGGHVPITVIPEAGHHIMLDQPVALIAVLQGLVGEWLRP